MIRSDASRYRRPDRGAAAVELALVMPLLLLILFGIIDFGRMFNAQITLTQAAREGARAAAYGQTPETVRGRVDTASNHMDGLTYPTLVGCPDASGAATVEVHAPFEFVTPLSVFAGMFGATPAGEYDLESTGVVTCSS
jgi:uncharacterized membrane protein